MQTIRPNIVVLVAATALLAGCTGRVEQTVSDTVDTTTGLGAAKTKLEQVDPRLAAVKCQELCRKEVAKGADLSAGPCLGDPIAGLPNWVCDVAHQPRQSADNQPENQCAAFRQGTAKHFVEVDEDCNVIKTY